MEEWHKFYGGSAWEHTQGTGSDDEDAEDQVVYHHESEREQLRRMYRQRSHNSAAEPAGKEHETTQPQIQQTSAARRTPPASGAGPSMARNHVTSTPYFEDEDALSPPFDAMRPDVEGGALLLQTDRQDAFGDFDVPLQETAEGGETEETEEQSGAAGSRENFGQVPSWDHQGMSRSKFDGSDAPGIGSMRSWLMPSPPPPAGNRNQKGKEKAKFSIRSAKAVTPSTRGGGPLAMARRLQEMAGAMDVVQPGPADSTTLPSARGATTTSLVQVSQDQAGCPAVPLARRLNAMAAGEGFRTPARKTPEARKSAQQKTPLSLQKQLLERLRACSPEPPAAAKEDIGEPAFLTPATSRRDANDQETSSRITPYTRPASATPKIAALLRDRTESLEVEEDFCPRTSRGHISVSAILQRAVASQKRQLTQLSRGVHAGVDASLDVRIVELSREAHLRKCEVEILRFPKDHSFEASQTLFVFFSAKTNPELDLDVGTTVRIFPPWNEVVIPSRNCKVLMCTYNCQTVLPPFQLS